PGLAPRTLGVARGRVIASRVGAHELARSVASPPALAVLGLGVQDTPYGSARLAVAARTKRFADDGSLTLVWSVRGAAHLHRHADLPELASALWPGSDADATARLPYPQIKEGARLGLAAFAAADALHPVVKTQMAKGDVGGEVSGRGAPWQAGHVAGGLLQQVGLPAGVRVVPVGQATRLAPAGGWPGVPAEASGTASLVRTYLRLLGPATPADVARFLGTTRTEVRRAWPEDLAEVRLDDRSAWLPANQVAAPRSAPPPRLARPPPPADP